MDDWPPYSPDLNVIEVIWAIMKHRLEKKVVKTLDQLKIEIQDIWDNLSIPLINRLIDTMPKRLIKCVQNNGLTVLNY